MNIHQNEIIEMRNTGSLELYHALPTKSAVCELLESIGLTRYSDSPSSKLYNRYYRKYSGNYYLHNNEYSQCDYRPRKYGKAWGVHVQYYYSPRTYNAPTSGRASYEHLADLAESISFFAASK